MSELFADGPAEAYVIESVTAGKDADFFRDGPDLGRYPKVRAALIRELCLGRLPPIGTPFRKNRGSEHNHDVRITGARITGQLDLKRDHLACRVFLTTCRFDDGPDLTDARTDHSIHLTGCFLPSFTANRLHSKSDLELREVQVTGEVSFIEMHLAGDLRCTKSVFENPNNSTINGTSMTVGGSVHFDNVHSTGAVKLMSAHIKGDFDCRETRLHHPEERSLDGTHLTVEGELIWENNFKAKGEVCLQWAHLKALRGTGASLSASPQGCALDAEGLHVADDILLDGRFKALGEVRLLAARVENKLRFTTATLENSGGYALNAERIEARDFYLDKVQASGEIRLVGAEIHTQLNCTAARFDRDSGGYALDAELLVCRGEVYLNEGFTAYGEVRLIGAEIKRELNCTRGEFNNTAGYALDADGMTTEGSVFLNAKFKAVGEVRFARATVGRQLDCVGGTIERPGGLALDMSGLVCRGDVKLSEEFHAVGTVKLEGARITRDLDCKEGHFSAIGSTAFDAKELNVGGSFIWKLVDVPAGTVDLSFAFARFLKDDNESWPTDKRVTLTGFTYESLNGMSAEDRNKWLKNTPDYAAQPYQQLTRVYLQNGQDDRAMQTVTASHKDLRERGKINWWGKKWDSFIGLSVRYGYQFHRPVVVLLTLALVNVIVFYIADYTNLMHATGKSGELTSKGCDGNYPCFVPPIYAFEILTPVLNLRQINYWLPTPMNPWGVVLSIWVALNIIIGWVASISIAGGLTYAFGCDRRSRA